MIGHRLFATLAVSLLSATLAAGSRNDPRPGVDWPSFRGIRASGVAEGYSTPTMWNVPEGRGVQWKTPIEGLGHSSPVVWGTRLCVTTAISIKPDAALNLSPGASLSSVDDHSVHTWKLVCVDKRNGRRTLDLTILSGVPKIGRHARSTHANATLATDGTHLVAMLGSEGLYTYDMNGRLLWKKDFGLLDSGYYVDPSDQWAFGSSPIIHNGVVVVQADVQKDGFLAAFDVNSGKELWRTRRQDVSTWGTPTIHQVGSVTEVLVNGWRHIGAYDFSTGAEIWRLKGAGDIPVPTPVAGGGLVYITSAHSHSSVLAIRETASGDISLGADETSNAHVAWSAPRDGAYMVTPVLYRDLLYVSKGSTPFVAFDARTGERVYQRRLGDGAGDFTASLVAADGKVYVTSEDGDVFVVKAGRTFEVLATNPLGESVLATPAISEGVLFFRTVKSLIAIGG